VRSTLRWRCACSIAGAVILSPLASAPLDAQNGDWASLARYHEANRELGEGRPGEQRVVFYGNSITDAWAQYFETMFPGEPYVGRGISGQTTPQMLVRFRQDVLALDPAVVVILAGTNDIAGNTGPSNSRWPMAFEPCFRPSSRHRTTLGGRGSNQDRRSWP
jgi:hypothetical protein